MMKRIIVFLLFVLVPVFMVADAQVFRGRGTTQTSFNTQIFNCTGWQALGGSKTGNCGVNVNAAGGSAFAVAGNNTSTINSNVLTLIPSGTVHAPFNLIYQTLTDIRKFKTTFTFIPNGMNVDFFVQNTNNNPATNGNLFQAGAGCESGFFQYIMPGQTVPPNNLSVWQFDSYSPLRSTQGFTYSSVQYYVGFVAPNPPNYPGQEPCVPLSGNYPFALEVYKISTSPVAMNSPAGAQNTSTGHTYSATFTYDNGTQIMDLVLFDVTAGGTCTPVTSATCFHQQWTGVNVPSNVGGLNTAYICIGGATGIASSFDLKILTWSYFTP